MTTLVSYRLKDGVASITMDDGKVNVMSLAMQGELHAALDRAEVDGAVVLLSGRPGVFCAGFDLPVVQAGGAESTAMVRGGFELSERMLSFPLPIVIACSGHAIAMGFFLVLSGDYRIGAAGDFKLVANEVAIGLTMPEAAAAIARQRLTPAAFERAMTVSDVFTPANAVESGVLDRVVEAGDLEGVAREVAVGMTALDMVAHAATKRRVRADSLAAIRRGIEAYAGLSADD